MPRRRMPPRAVSVTASWTPGWASTLPGAARAGEVAVLDQLAVEVDAVGARPADVQPGGAADVRDHPRGGGLAVGAGDRDDRDLRPHRRRRVAGRLVADPVADRGDQLGQLARRAERVDHLDDRRAERPGPAARAPTGRRPPAGVRRSRADPDADPADPRLAGDPAYDVADHAGSRTAAGSRSRSGRAGCCRGRAPRRTPWPPAPGASTSAVTSSVSLTAARLK